MLTVFKNLGLFLIFLKQSIFFKFFNIQSTPFLNLLNKLIPRLYYKFYANFFYKVDPNPATFYKSNLSISLYYWNLSAVKRIYYSKNTLIKNASILNEFILEKQYGVPVALSDIPLKLNKLKFFFYFNLFLFIPIWHQLNFNNSYTLNFFFPSNELWTINYFSGFFFKIFKF